MELIHTLFGEGKELNMLQMACRTFVIFFITLGLIRLSGMRTFGKKSAFDSIIVIMLGAVLSRAIAGASPFFPTVVAGLVLSLIHKAVAYLCATNKKFSTIIKGEKFSLYKDGRLNEKNMRRCEISTDDLLEELRNKLHQDSFDNISEIVMETSGKLSLLKKDQQG